MKRRDFLVSSGLVSAGALLMPKSVFSNTTNFISQRPPVDQRNFISAEVERVIAEVKSSIKNPELAWMFENCFPNTLDTTVTHYEKNGKPYTYVITGDIDAMWLRDSSAQIWPYLQLTNKDEKLKRLVQGVINKQTEFVQLDPYANAFYDDPEKKGEWESDNTKMKPGIHERKWEIDSLCYVIRLAHGYWKTTGDDSLFDANWQNAMKLIVKTFREQQRMDGKGPYSFTRKTEVPTDTQFGRGFGNPTKKVGLIHSMFRPSDDSTFYPFLVSSNMFAVVSLRQLAEMFTTVVKDKTFAGECNSFANEVDQALKKYAVGEHLDFGKIYPLEVDGFGNKLFMDDANVPNILSLPYLGYCTTEDPIYKNSRRFSLSDSNPWFHEGKFAKGIGGPHIGEDKIWPLGLVMQSITSKEDKEILYCLKTLKNTHAGTGFMHESFNVNDPNDFSRSWFAWANTLFGELILKLYHENKQILKNDLA